MAKAAKKVVIDADYLVYAAGFACEATEYLLQSETGETIVQHTDWHTVRKAQEDGTKLFKHHTVEPLENCLHSVKKMIDRIVQECEKNRKCTVEPELYLTGSGNYRERVATIRPYKGNRDPRHVPQYKREITKYLHDVHGATTVRGIEADDWVSILQTEAPDVIVAGIDKDLLQVPGIHYNPGDKERPWRTMNNVNGLCRLYVQILQGDTTDNYAGCYKVGKVAARKAVKATLDKWRAREVDVLELERSLWDTVLELYDQSIDKYGDELTGYDDPEAAAVENARLAYMIRRRHTLRLDPDGFLTPVELWVPPHLREEVS
jgi:5'-3' exonuclease